MNVARLNPFDKFVPIILYYLLHTEGIDGNLKR